MHWATMLKSGLVLGLVASLAGCGLGPNSPDKDPLGRRDTKRKAAGRMTGFYTKNVVYRVDKDITLFLPNVIADVQVYKEHQPFVPADTEDFMVHIHTGDLVVGQREMAAIFNKYTFNYPDAPIKEIEIEAMDGKLKMAGKMKKGIWIPFEAVGELTPNGRGQLVMRCESMKSAGIPVKGLLDLLGVEMASLINANEERGVRIDHNDIVIFPDRLLPPPAMKIFCVGAEVSPGKVVMKADDGVRKSVPPLSEPWAKNWILMYGGNIMINNHLVMDAKLQMIDDSPQDPMYYYMPVYREQLEAGFTVSTRDSTIAYLSDVHGTTVEKPRYRPNLGSGAPVSGSSFHRQ